MSQYPVQVRTVDPFATYNSDTVNKLTRIANHGEDALESYSSLRCTLDATSKTIVHLSPGILYKDDMRIEISASTIVNFESAEFYENFGAGFSESGRYYVLMEYLYQKSRPAPQAKIVILKPSQLSAFEFSDNWIFLNSVLSEFNGSTFDLTEVLDYDPDVLTVKRNYIKVFAGTETLLPTFNEESDQTRIVYDVRNDKFWFGYRDRWAEAGGGGGGTILENIDTSLAQVGSICRIEPSGVAIATLADDLSHQADIVTLVSSTSGRGLIVGNANLVPVESGVLIAVGNIIYLSNTEAGKVTNVKTAPFYQILGRATTNGSPSSPISMVFSPKIMMLTALEGKIESWTASGTSPAYYHDVDITALDTVGSVLCNFFNDVTLAMVTPPKVLFLGDILKIYNNNNTDQINYIITAGGGGAGGSGGGVTILTDHNLLTNLSYAASGHTGFAPNPHSNSFHSELYVVLADINYTNLNVNGSVGTGGSQVSRGDHTHSQFSLPSSIPTGSIILFYANTAVAGYNLITTINDSLVYVTKGSVAGGEAGGINKVGGTWTQPLHQHSVETHQHDLSNHYHGFTAPSHLHQWFDQGSPNPQGGTGYTYASDGVTLVNINPGGVSNYGLISGGGNYDGYQYKGLGYTSTSTTSGANTGGPSNNISGVGGPSSTGDSSSGSTWRPFGINMTMQQKI